MLMQSLILGQTPIKFIYGYAWRHRWLHILVLISVLMAVACSTGTRYSMKYLVDAIAAGPDMIEQVWLTLAVFTTLIGGDFLLWRLGGWAAARAFPRVGVDLRLDLLDRLLRRPMRYFSDQFTGA